MPQPPFLEVRGVSKSFGLARVLNKVSIDFTRGQVHALVGENGAGKSTLMKIMAGVIAPDHGQLQIEGSAVVFANALEAKTRGIAMIFQEPALFPDLTIAENIFLGRQLRQQHRPWLDTRTMNAQTVELLAAVGSRLPPDLPVRGLSVAEEQMVDIASAISRNPRLLIVDEPTASLTPSEVARLFELFRGLCAKGMSIAFIGHRLEEIFEIADRITVLRDGEVVDSRSAADFDEATLISAMVGRELVTGINRKSKVRFDEKVLEVRDLGRQGLFQGITFDVKAGEILGMAGLVGAGRSDIATTIFGINRPGVGEVLIRGVALPHGKPHLAVKAGIGFVPEDRKSEGLAERLSNLTNASIVVLKKFTKHGWVNRAMERSVMAQYLERMSVKAKGLNQSVMELSGGNQQKIVLAKWIAIQPQLLILDEPTRGVDVGAKREIHELIDGLADQGVAILLISSDMSEVIDLSDRIIVVSDGRIAGELPKGASPERVLQLMVAGVDALELDRERNRAR